MKALVSIFATAAAALVLLASCGKEKPLESTGVFTGIYANPVLMWGSPKADVAPYMARLGRAFDLKTATFYWPSYREIGSLYTYENDALKCVFVYVDQGRYSRQKVEEWLSGQYTEQEKSGWVTKDGKTEVSLTEVADGNLPHFIISYFPKSSGEGISEASFTRPGFLCPQCGEFILLPLEDVALGGGFSCAKCNYKVNILTIR